MLIDLKKFNLEQKIKDGTLSHAVILSGDFDEITLDICKSFVCENDKKPCNVCSACVHTNKGINPDILFLEFDSNDIKVDDIRKIRRDVFVKPTLCKKKIYVIKDGQKLNINAQNALLKTLEEPPKHVCFIIECTDEKKLATTILSRCSIYNFNKKEQEIPSEILKNASNIINGIINKSELVFFETEIKTKQDLILLISAIKTIIRDCFLLSKNSIDLETSKNLIKSKDTEEIFRIYDICNEVEKSCEFNIDVANMLCFFATEIGME